MNRAPRAPIRPTVTASAGLNNGRVQASGRAQVGGANRNVFVEGNVSAGRGGRPTGSIQVGGQIRF